MSTRIVVIDDHQLLRDALRLVLQAEPGLTVVGEAACLDEGCACLRDHQPDLALADATLPGETPRNTAIRLHDACPSTRLILLGDHIDADTVHQSLLGGAHGFLGKHDSVADLLRAVQSVAAGKAYLSTEAATAVSQTLLHAPGSKTPLSRREHDVLVGLANGLSYKQIADLLRLSPKTVETYRARLIEKTGCPTAAELVRYAVRHHLVAP